MGETAVKSKGNGTTRLNATAFYYDYSDFQTYTQVGPSLVVFNIDSEVFGAEIELVANPWEGWEFLFGVSILDAQVKDLNYGAGLQSDVEMTNSPELSLNGLGRYSWNAFTGSSIETVGAPRWFGGTVSYHWN